MFAPRTNCIIIDICTTNLGGVVHSDPSPAQAGTIRIEVFAADGSVTTFGTLRELRNWIGQTSPVIEGIHYYQSHYKPGYVPRTDYPGPVAVIIHAGGRVCSTRPRQRGRLNFNPFGDLVAALEWMDNQPEG